MEDNQYGNNKSIEVCIRELRAEKIRLKSNFTKEKNRIEKLIVTENVTREQLNEERDKLTLAFDETLNCITQLLQFYTQTNSEKLSEDTLTELDIIENKMADISEKIANAQSSSIQNKSHNSNDVWKHLKKVSIPTFSGDKKLYSYWKAAFSACVDKAPVSDEYKLLQLKQHLSGEALSAIQHLGHTAAAYKLAKDRLEGKFGGQQRQVALQLELLGNFKPIRMNNAQDLQKFADILEISIANLSDINRETELGDGTLYLQLLKKLPENLLTNYHRWIHETEQSESVRTLFQWISSEASYQIRATEASKGLEMRCDVSRNLRSHYSNKKMIEKINCSMCNSDHGIWSCPKFKDLTVNERWEYAKSKGLCFRCLDANHLGNNCVNSKICKINSCERTHHRLLHCDSRTLNQLKINKPVSTSLSTSTHVSNVLAMRIVPVLLQSKRHQIVVNALLDDASTKTYINRRVANQLQLFGKKEEISVNVINGIETKLKTEKVHFTLKSSNEKFSRNVEALTTDEVTGMLTAVDWIKHKKKWTHLKDIKFSKLSHPCTVDVLIGLDYLDFHRSLKEVCGKPGEPIARLTPLGWTCVGPIRKEQENASTLLSLFTKTTDFDNLSDVLKSFWEVETVSSLPTNLSKKDEEIIKSTSESIEFKEGRYCVALPWKLGHSKLRNNYQMALARLHNTEKKLHRDPKIQKIYSETIRNYEDKDYIRKLDPSELSQEDSWYLPHFPVIRLDRATTKVRIVFDAAAKYKEVSLNEKLEIGPKLQRSIFDILLRFRAGKIALVCDIAEMYLNIAVRHKDRAFLRFLWKNSSGEVEAFEFKRLVFGINSSPFLAQFVTQEHAKQNKTRLPLAAETVLNSTYMDDSLDSVDDLDTGKRLFQELKQLWSSAGLSARKWLSNSSELMQEIPVDLQAKEIDIKASESQAIRTLGIIWNSKADKFQFISEGSNEMNWTKRKFLSKISTIYDPLGLISPIVVIAKILMQIIWISGLDWDEPLPETFTKKINSWFNSLKNLGKIEIPRYLGRSQKNSKIHTFVDASSDAYGAVSYLVRGTNEDVFTSQIIASKSKVSPLESVSIPRLELMAAILGLRLTQSICNALQIEITSVIFWTDSTNVLSWIYNRSKMFKPFVANRAGLIQSITEPRQWRHVPTEKNPADVVSRGSNVDDLYENDLWWHGPEFLQFPDHWPSIPKFCNAIQEVRKGAENQVFLCYETATSHLVKLENYSKWNFLKRTIAYILRFLNNIASPCNKITGPLNTDELNEAEMLIIRTEQRIKFNNEYKKLSHNTDVSDSKQLACLNPFLDEDRIIRSNGRLSNVNWISYDTRFPIILPRHSQVTQLIIYQYHLDGLHVVGTNHILANISTRFWIPCAREAIKELKCPECDKRKAKALTQQMAPLPAMRLQEPTRVFNCVGVDFAGPFLSKQGRGKVREKRYLCLFTCLHIRAVHLELAYGLDTSSFLNAFFRMVSRRGLPKLVISDNGKNFVSANRELKDLVKKLDADKILETTANRGIVWQFNPPLAPHFGGVFESMIKIAKKVIGSILKEADPTDEELTTVFLAAESIINSRPLTYQSADPRDEIPITPNHFLQGQSGGVFASSNVDTSNFSYHHRWRRVQEWSKQFWKKWLNDWLPTLTIRKKWTDAKKNISVGDIVLVSKEETVRGRWPLGRILQVFPGPDGKVRVVRVKIGEQEFIRPITRICPLKVSQDSVS